MGTQFWDLLFRIKHLAGEVIQKEELKSFIFKNQVYIKSYQTYIMLEKCSVCIWTYVNNIYICIKYLLPLRV